jgi:hypothetical protein
MSTSSTPDLDARMAAAGMMPLSEMLERIPLGGFLVHKGVTDLATFSDWLNMRREEMLKLQIQLELDNQQDDELYSWAVAHTAVLGEVVANFKAATEASARVNS